MENQAETLELYFQMAFHDDRRAPGCAIFHLNFFETSLNANSSVSTHRRALAVLFVPPAKEKPTPVSVLLN